MTRRRLVRAVVVAAAIVLALALAGFLLLRSRAFHRYILAEMVHRAEQATGGKVEIGDFSFRLSGLRLDLYRVTLHGTEPDAARPLCRIGRAALSFSIVSVMERRVDLRAVEMDRLAVRLIIRADGESNLPHPPATAAGAKPFDLFSLGIGRLTLHSGEIDYNDRKVAVSAVLHQVHADASFTARKREYTGSLGYRDGEIHFGKLSPLPHSLELRFSADPSGLRADPLVVRTAASHLTIRATLENYSRPSVRGSYSMNFPTAEASRWLNAGVIPAGTVATEGAFEYQWAAGRAFLDSLTLRGNVRSSRLQLRAGEIGWAGNARITFATVTGAYTLEAGTFRGSSLEAAIFGGRVRADVVVHHVATNRDWILSASLRAVSLAGLRAAMPGYRLARFPLEGRVSASAQASWKRGWAGLRVQSDATLEAMLQPLAVGGRGNALSLDGAIHLVFDAETRTVSLAQSVLRTPESEMDFNGSIGPRSSLDIAARTSDLGEIETLVVGLRVLPGGASMAILPAGLSGAAEFQGALEGPVDDLQLKGQFTATGLAVRHAQFSRLRTGVAISASKIELTAGELRAARGGARFQASLALRNWALDKPGPVSVQVTADDMSLEALQNLAGKNYPVNGIVSAQIALHGSIARPAGAGTIRISKGEAWNQPIPEATFRFQASGNTVGANAVMQTPAGNATARVTYNPESQAYDGEIDLASVRLEKLHALERARVPVSGVLTASIRGQGTLKAPHAHATFAVPTLRIGGQTITAVSATATVVNQIATLALSSSFSGAAARAQGTLHLTGGYDANVSFQSGTIDAGPLIENYLPGGGGELRCLLAVDGWLRGPLKDRQKLTAHVELPALRLARGAIEVSSAAPVEADYRDGVLIIHPAELKGPTTDFRVEASMPVAAGAPLEASLDGAVDFHLLQILDPDWVASGKVEVKLAVRGSRAHPDVQGQMQLVNAAIAPARGPIGIQNLNAAVRMANGRAEIARLTGQSGGGTITGSGSVAYTRGVVFAVALNVNHVRVRYPQGVREVLSGNVRLSGSLPSAMLSGQISVDELSLAPSFDLAAFAEQFNVVSIPSGEATGFAGRTKLNVGLRSSRELALASSEVHLRGAANLRVHGTLADPVLVGRATLAGGDIVFNGRSYRVENGVVDFVNPVVTQPVVNIGLVTTVDQYTLRLNFIGPFDQLRTTYSSDPPLAPVDILNLLVSGKTAEAPGTGLGARSILAQGIASPLSGRAQKLTGISSLTIDPQAGGNGTNPGARIAVQQQVTRNLFLMFSVDVTTTQDDLVQLEYRLSRRWSVEATRNQDGGYSLEIRSRKTF